MLKSHGEDSLREQLTPLSDRNRWRNKLNQATDAFVKRFDKEVDAVIPTLEPGAFRSLLEATKGEMTKATVAYDMCPESQIGARAGEIFMIAQQLKGDLEMLQRNYDKFGALPNPAAAQPA